MLIIDDGWQLTDVDAPYAKAPTSQLADKMKVQGNAKEFLETTQVCIRLCGEAGGLTGGLTPTTRDCAAGGLCYGAARWAAFGHVAC